MILIVCKTRLEVLARSKPWQDLGLGKMKVVTSLSMQAITEVQSIIFYLFYMYLEFNMNSTLNSHNILVFYQIQSTLSSHVPSTRLATSVNSAKYLLYSLLVRNILSTRRCHCHHHDHGKDHSIVNLQEDHMTGNWQEGHSLGYHH